MSDPMANVPPPPMLTATPAPTLPRWGVQTGFFQRRQPAFWLFVVLLAVTGLIVLTQQLFFLENFASGWIFSIFLLTLYVIPVLIAIWVLDLFEREPVSLVVAAFLWGGVVAIGLAAPVNTALLQVLAKVFSPTLAQTWGAAIVAPPVEETFKVLGVIMIYLIARSEIDDLFDGFVYGAVVGLGFAAVENVQYFVQAVAGSGGGDQLGPVFGMFMLRSILVGAYMHVMWTALTGLGIAYYVTQRDQPRQKRLLVAVGLFLAAVLAHFIWNSPLLGNLLSGIGGILLFGIIKGLPFLAFLVFMVFLARRREHRWFSALTARDVGTDVMTEAELGELGGLRNRWSARRRISQRKGAQGGKLAGQLQREQINLAMIRSRTSSDDDPSVVAQRDRIRAIREQLVALPDVAVPVAMPATTTAGAQAGVVAAGSPPPAIPGWAPTHLVPLTGMAAWDAPDPSRPPIVSLAGGVQLSVAEQQGAWARVIGSNGWMGWVDGRLLVRMS